MVVFIQVWSVHKENLAKGTKCTENYVTTKSAPKQKKKKAPSRNTINLESGIMPTAFCHCLSRLLPCIPVLNNSNNSNSSKKMAFITSLWDCIKVQNRKKYPCTMYIQHTFSSELTLSPIVQCIVSHSMPSSFSKSIECERCCRRQWKTISSTKVNSFISFYHTKAYRFDWGRRAEL